MYVYHHQELRANILLFPLELLVFKEISQIPQAPHSALPFSRWNCYLEVGANAVYLLYF